MVDNSFITDIKTKANIFNKFFLEQCTLLVNDSVIPINQDCFNAIKTRCFRFQWKGNSKDNRALHIHKAHDNDDISIRMIQIVDKGTVKTINYLISKFS